MEQDEFDLLKLQVETLIEIVKQLTRIADVLEVPSVSLKERLEMDLSWLKWCYLFLPSEGLKKDIQEMAAELKKLEDDEAQDRS